MLKLRSIVALALMGGAAAAMTTRAIPLTSFSLSGGALLQEPEMPEPTAQHKMLMEGVGEWVGTLTMSVPGVGDMEVDATDSITAIGPFWTQSQFRCDMPGMQYHGTGVVGYEPDAKEFVGTWSDNTNPKLAVMRGNVDKETGALHMHWTAMVQGMDKPVPHRSVSVQTKDSYTSTFYVGEGDAEVQQMTISMKRRDD